jgi:hypothetical protein
VAVAAQHRLAVTDLLEDQAVAVALKVMALRMALVLLERRGKAIQVATDIAHSPAEVAEAAGPAELVKLERLVLAVLAVLAFLIVTAAVLPLTQQAVQAAAPQHLLPEVRIPEMEAAGLPKQE